MSMLAPISAQEDLRVQLPTQTKNDFEERQHSVDRA